jgi:hypothetical protein
MLTQLTSSSTIQSLISMGIEVKHDLERQNNSLDTASNFLAARTVASGGRQQV